MVGTSKSLIAIVCCLALIAGTTADAGILKTHPDALNTDGPDGGYWRGSVHFDNLSGLAGDIDFAVFTEADFLANFGGQGYVPSSWPTGGLVYTYQLFNSGDDAISAEIVGISNPAYAIGSWDEGDTAPSSAAFVGTNARWEFSSPAIATGDSSWGLAFSSPNKPMSGAGLVIDGGASIVQFGLPTPSDEAIPEPSTMILVSLCGCVLLLLRGRQT